MYKIIKDGAALGMTEAPNYIKHNGGSFVLCPEAEANGIAYNGTPYQLLGREPMEGTAGVVMLERVDAGAEIAGAAGMASATAAMTGQAAVAAKLYAGAATDIPDAEALKMPDMFRTWEEVLADGKKLAEGVVIKDGGTLYRVVAPGGAIPQQHQPPHGEGMLAVYRPIDQTHAGTLEDPIPWVYGMDCAAGKYYTLDGAVYLCKTDMPACVWAPGTPGLWQWEAVEA